jgi:hypothetical protein
LTDDAFRIPLIERHVGDPVVRAFWRNEYAAYTHGFRTEAIAPIQNKNGKALMVPSLRNMLAQPRSTITLLRAERVLDTLPGVSIAYGDLIRDEEALRNALQQLYPEADLPALGYLDDAFRRERAQVLRRRDSLSFVRLRDRVAALRAEAIPSTSG